MKCSMVNSRVWQCRIVIIMLYQIHRFTFYYYFNYWIFGSDPVPYLTIYVINLIWLTDTKRDNLHIQPILTYIFVFVNTVVIIIISIIELIITFHWIRTARISSSNWIKENWTFFAATSTWDIDNKSYFQSFPR